MARTGFSLNFSQLEAVLKGIEAKASDLRPIMLGPIADDVREMFQERFLTHGAFGGTPWAPLEQATIYKKLMAGQGYNHPLRRTDELFESLTERGAKYGFARMLDAFTLEVGTTHPAAPLHQTGTKWMPARPIIPNSQTMLATQVNSWARLIGAHLQGGRK